ncbi:CvpA family protein [Thiovibrio frasassiensis]|uniref:CvpA family protein n=1 Tax=Thiovibrio frasassiensis TaxID=2984131 RepID=UPI0035306999
MQQGSIMTAIDFGVIAIFLLFLVRGVWIGFVRQLASLAALILGYLFAGRYYEQISPRLSSLIPSPQLCFLVTYALLFLAVFVGVLALGFVLKKVMSISLLGWFDRFMGGIFGLVKAGVLTSVFFMVISGLLADSNPLITGSLAAPYLSKSSTFLLSFVSDQNLQRHLLPREPAIDFSATVIPAGQPLRLDSAIKAK